MACFWSGHLVGVQHCIGSLHCIFGGDDSAPGPGSRPVGRVHLRHPLLRAELVVADWRVGTKDVSPCVRVYRGRVVLSNRHLGEQKRSNKVQHMLGNCEKASYLPSGAFLLNSPGKLILQISFLRRFGLDHNLQWNLRARSILFVGPQLSGWGRCIRQFIEGLSNV